MAPARKAPPAPPSIRTSVFKIAPQIVRSALDADKSKKLLYKNVHAEQAVRATHAGIWSPAALVPKSKPADKASAASTSPVSKPLINFTDIPIAKSFDNGHPMTDKVPALKCNHCRRAVLRHQAKKHVEECIAKKQEKQRRKKEAKDARDAAARKAEQGSGESSDEEAPSGAKAVRKADGTLTAADGGAIGKKRKAGDVLEEPKKKKSKKDEPKAKMVKPKAPVDVEKQCGVELPQGGQCARSLTCKSHSMGAKRAVAGRSAPYDKLLAEYQRKNQAKLQKAALENQSLLADDDMSPNGPVDSEEERDLVLAAIHRARPQPLYRARMYPLKRKYEYVRLKEMMGNALGARGGGGLFGIAPAA